MSPRRKRPDDGQAFLPDFVEGGPACTKDEIAETLAEEFIESATSAEEQSEDIRNETVPEELGGPFVEVPASEEFDGEPDASNPEDAEKAPFPQAMRVPRG
jgi:hypothetical protein